MTFDEWWTKHYENENIVGADRTFGEETWKAAQRDAWETVFQIVPDRCDLASRQFIKELEAAREKAEAGPLREVVGV